MGTAVNLTLVCESEELADNISKEIFTTIKKYENKFSRFLPNSELSNINNKKQSVVSDEFITVLEKSLQLAIATNNGFNPLTQISNLGYTKSFDLIKDTNQIITDRPYNTDIRQIVINKKINEVIIQPDQKLDFGGILKGYLSQSLADEIMIKNKEIKGCIVNIGGDLSTRGLYNIHKPFIFFLYNPITGVETQLTIENRSLVTSGVYARTWQTNLGDQNHIVDTHSQKNPDNNLVSVSIINNDGAWAEATCKLFLTKGIDLALKTLPANKNNYLYFVVHKDGSTQTNII
jgi:thiamine biosynthesis lipoprotein